MNAAADLGIDVTVTLASPIAEQYLAKRIPALEGINAFTRRRIRNVLAEEIAAGAPLGRQIRRMRREFRIFRRGVKGPRGPSRARTTARTENGIAWGTGQHAQMRESGVIGEIWITSRDARVRQSHAALEGACALIDELFANGLLHPLDPSGPADEVINCRCVAAPAPRGRDETRLATYDQRTRYWRTIIAEQRPHELALIRALRVEWLTQERAMVDAMRAAA